MKEQFTALYERLSRDDEQQGESNSIINQKKYLEDYARSKGFRNIRHFSDDGYTGTNFNRPGFQSMLEEVKAGNVNTIIVKDMSRFGRNYLQVGFYTEMVFPDKGVRFIAVNNGIDSNNPTENEFTPFLNIMNEWYARDTSKKIRAVFRNRMENGLRCSGSIPYGFYRKPDDKQTLYVDEEAAKIIRRIFKMAAEGITTRDIARTLRAEKVLIPAAYQEQAENQVSHQHDYFDPYFWNPGTIRTILERQEYLGHTVLGKTVRENFKTKKHRRAKPEEMLIFPNTHEAIIDQETWDLANKLRKRSPKRTASGTYSHRLSGFCYCADCGARMGYSAPPAKKIEAGTVQDSDSSYNCGNFRNIRHKCTNHYVKASDLEAVLVSTTKLVAAHVLQDEDTFVSELMEQWSAKQQQLSTDDKKDLANARKRFSELDTLIQGLYENQIKGIMPERQIQRLMSQYDNEQLELEQRIAELENSVNAESASRPDANRFISLLKRYKDFDEITDTMLYELIDRIEVHAPMNGRTRYRYQQIDVCFNFIGKYLPPMPVITEEERRAKIDEYYAEKRRAKGRKQCARKKDWLTELKKRAKTDPEAAEELKQYYEKKRELSRQARARAKAEREASPEYQAMLAEKTAKKEQYQRRVRFNKLPIAELEEIANTDEYAAEILVKRRTTAAEKNRRVKEKRKARIASDPEYAAIWAEKAQRRNEKARNKRAALIESAKTDPEAAAKYEALKAHERTTQNKYNANKRARAKVDPEYAVKRQAFLKEKSKKDYDYYKNKMDDLKSRALTDPEAAEQLRLQKESVSKKNRKFRENLKERAKTDPKAAAQIEDLRRRKRESYRKNKELQRIAQ